MSVGKVLSIICFLGTTFLAVTTHDAGWVSVMWLILIEMRLEESL